MEKAIVYLFTSPTCPGCPPAKRFIHEFKKTRDDFILKELSTATHEGSKKARKFGIMAVPTFVIKGPEYPQPIGLRGLQSTRSMNKYIDLSYGIGKEEKKISLREKFKEGIKIGKIRIKF
jgi:predicted DsbA family dithiol-disulfide isomerase